MVNNGNSGRRRILVIGGVAAGASAASKAKRIDPDADVKMIQGFNALVYVVHLSAALFGELFL